MSLYEKFMVLSEGPFDIIIDPQVGHMELQEIGIADKLKYNPREQYAYAQNIDLAAVREIVLYICDNLGISGEDTEIYDRMTEKLTIVDLKIIPLDAQSFWATFWYDGGVGHIHRQEKMEILIRNHEEDLPYRMDYDETKKKAWIQYVARDCKDSYQQGMALDQFNEYIKEQNLLWLLEDITGLGYDIWDFLEDINDTMLRM